MWTVGSANGRSVRWLLLAGSLGLTLSLTPRTAMAEPTPDEIERAKAAYAEGEAYARAKRYPEAASAFARADSLAPNDTALEAALEAALLAGDAALAMNLVERAARSPSSSALRAVGEARQRFEASVAMLRVPCLEETPPCTASVAGTPITSARHWVAPGRIAVALERDRATHVEEIITVAREETTVVFPALVEEVELKPLERPAPTAPDEPDRAEGLSPWWFVAGCGLTAVLGGVALGHYVAAESAFADFEAANGVADRSTLETMASDVESLDTRTNVFLVATGVAGVATAVLGVVLVDWSGGSSDEPSFARARVNPSPGGGTLNFEASF